MRIWSIHPQYLDTKGLVALWRETLLAKHVLEGKTKGYKNHPQLIRFKAAQVPLDAVNYYLQCVYIEAENRNYNFDKTKIDWSCKHKKLKVTQGQVTYEAAHLLQKLSTRDRERYNLFKAVRAFEVHPLFKIADGDIESWEIVN